MEQNAQIHIKIIMAVFNPDATYLDEQIKSISYQTYKNLSLIIVDADGKSSHIISNIINKYDIPYKIVNPSITPLNSYAAFASGCREAIENSSEEEFFIGFSDQDDVWEITKLEELSLKLKKDGISLVHSDAALVDKNGNEIFPSMFAKERRLKRSTAKKLLYINNITGMTVLCKKHVIEASLPFPKQESLYFYHDLWIGLVASILGKIDFIDKPLVCYRQHEANVVGAIIKKQRLNRNFNAKSILRNALNSYYVAAYLAKMLNIRAEEVASQGTKINNKTLQELNPYLQGKWKYHRFIFDAILMLPKSAPTSYQAVMRWVGGAVRQYLINRQRLLALNGHTSNVDRNRFLIAPGATPGYLRGKASQKFDHKTVTNFEAFVDRRRVAKWESQISTSAPSYINILIPSMNPSEMFAGLATIVEVGAELAEAGASVRFITTDASITSYKASIDFISKRVSNSSIMANIAIVDGSYRNEVFFNPQDRFVATAWWTAHIADSIISSGNYAFKKFVYIIQDYEPNFYAWGDDYAAAKHTYKMDFIPLINSKPLANYMKLTGELKDIDHRLIFRPNINIDHYSKVKRQSHKRSMVAIYGRPEVERNMFPLAISAINDFICRHNDKIENFDFISIGMDHPHVKLEGGKILRSIGKIPWDEYAEFLGRIDIGLALMYSPHPSHLPIEMAAAGIVTVTNRFEGKDLSVLTPYIISCDVTTDSVSKALNTALIKAPRLSESLTSRDINMEILGNSLKDVAGEVFRKIYDTEVKLK